MILFDFYEILESSISASRQTYVASFFFGFLFEFLNTGNFGPL